ncbi:hypothetical protein PIB30_043046 [Stylosanthes scabra]|uniref:Uncharacterized protein n=1 Tax=Stylosanthes scabra TaxID=79078 RepID=A0ABU6ZE62_9FABA|nr:hypothetical protein [Stylosanthes scabra]
MANSLGQVHVKNNSNPPFRAPAKAKTTSATNRSFRPKQPVKRALERKSPSPTNPEGSPHQVPPPADPHDNSTSGGPSKETITAASAGTQRLFDERSARGVATRLVRDSLIL